MTPSTARSRSRTHARSTVAPRGPRRISGPSRPLVAAGGAAALPRRRTGTTGLFARVRALPEHRVVDRLLRSRLWIWALGLLLGGIVAMQVSLLKLNSGISRAVETATTLERQNADLEAAIARKSAPDRIESGAATLGMVMPAAGDVAYLTAAPEDAARAARRMQPPSDEAAALLANDGIVPGSLAAPVAPAAAPTTTEAAPAGTPAPAATTAPAAAAVSMPAPAATTAPAPAAVSTPAPTAEPPTTAASQAPAGGGAVAGQG
jgi:hypothetical protein